MNLSDVSPPELVGLRIGEYKNLRDVWLPWSDGVALFGVNGAGKTNLLECLALLLGTEQTVALAGLRLSIPAPDNLSVVVRPGVGALPWPPDQVLPYDNWPDDFLRGAQVRAKDDNNWWRMLGATSGMDFGTGLASAGLPDPVVEFVVELSAIPVVRYGLARMEITEGHEPSRRFARTLLSGTVPDAVREAAGQLPDAFGPLRTYLSSTETSADPWIDVLELPSTSEPPATLQWLPRARSGEEVNDELIEAFELAMGPAQALSEVLGGLPLSNPPQGQDWHWWLHKLGERRASEELALTLPGVSIVSEGANDAEYALWSERGEAPKALSYTRRPDVLEFFSSGERRWVDEALATVSREFTRFAQQASWQAELFDELDEDTVMKAVLAVATNVDKNMTEDGYWSEETFDQLLRVLEPALVVAARAFLDNGEGDVLSLDRALSVIPSLAVLQPQLVIRAFDEPEAHLHPAAQRRVARALDSLRQRGSNVIIASHSPHFLDMPGWSPIHLEQRPDGTAIVPLTPHSKRAQSALARQLGINRGELLAGVNLVLIVEGLHDQIVLESLFGEELRQTGVAVIRMFGTDNLLATAELDFIDRYLDVPVVVLLDYTRIDRVERGRAQTDEEHKVAELLKSCRRRKRSLELVGLDRPDVIAYLSETAVREEYPDFPGWAQVLASFQLRRSRPPFKEWLNEQYRIDLTNSGRIRTILHRMKESNHLPVGELTRKVNTILAAAGSDITLEPPLPKQ